MKLQLTWDGSQYEVELTDDEVIVDGHAFPRTAAGVTFGGADVEATIDQCQATVSGLTGQFHVTSVSGLAGALEGGGGSGDIQPPMTGRLVELHVKEGDPVEPGQTLFVLEAMKMLNQVKSPIAGTVQGIHAAVGDPLEPGNVVMNIQ